MDTRERKELGVRIRQLRERSGLSQEEFAERVDVSRNTVSRWELGHNCPRRLEFRRICSAFGLEPTDLMPVASSGVNRRDFMRTVGGAGLGALAALDPTWRLTDVERLASSIRRQVVDEVVVEQLEERSRQHERLYFRLGTWQMLEAIQGHLRTTMLVADGAVPAALRPRLAAIVTHEAGHAAWLSYDLGRSGPSEQFYAISENAAPHASPEVGAYVKSYKSGVRVNQGQIREGHGLAVEAGAMGRTADPTVRAWFAAMEAQAASAAQDRTATEAALRRAANDLDAALGTSGPRLFWLDPWRLSAIAGACYARLGDAPSAEKEFEPALGYISSRSPRGRSEMQIDLASVALLRHDIPRACDLIADSLTAAQEAGSQANLDRIRQFRVRLHDWRRTPAVRDLDQLLTTA